MKIAFLIFAAAFVAVSCESEEKVDVSHGFGTDIDWVTWENAVDLAKEQNKPVFLLIHKTWCGACKALKKNFKGSNKRAELVELSKKFVMVNTEDDEEPEDERYAPDGAYIPRLFFLDKNGDPMAVDNKKNYPNNAYYFPQAIDVLKAMKVALKEFGGNAESEDEDTVKEEEKKEEAVKEKKKAKKDEEKTETAEKKKEKTEKKDNKKEEKKADKKEEKLEKKDKKEEKKADKKEKKEDKKEKSEEKVEKKKDEKKDKKDEKTEKKEKKDDKKEKKEKSEKKDKKEKSEKKEEKKEKEPKKDEKKSKKSDDEKKSKKDGEKKKKSEL